MNDICSQQLLKQRLNTNIVQQTLCTLLCTESADVLVRAYNELIHNIKSLSEEVADGFKKKESAIAA